MYNKLVAELVMGRVGYGPSLYGPSWLWAEFVMGRDVQLPIFLALLQVNFRNKAITAIETLQYSL